MRQTSLNMVYELAKKDRRIFFIGSDLGYKVLQKFKEEIPERFFMEGVSEANVIGMAAGLAFEGKIPYVNTISTFLTRRCYEQVVLDLCLHNLPVRLIGNGGGVVYAPLGPTHLAIEDIAILRAIPNMAIVAPSDAEEMKRLIPQTVDYPGPIYIRLGKGGDPVVSSDKNRFQIGKGIEMKSGKDALIATTGVTLKIALEAASKLSENGISAGVLHFHTVKPFDSELLLEKSSSVKAVVTVEEGVIHGGLGSAASEVLMESNLVSGLRFARVGIADIFPEEYGSQDSLMKSLGISTERVVSEITRLLA